MTTGYADGHDSKKVKRYLQMHQQLHLFYLPTYSPEYKPVELFWKWLKPKVYGFSAFGGIKELVDRFRKYVWHYNNDRLSALFDLALESTHIFYKYLSNNVYQKTKGERRH